MCLEEEYFHFRKKTENDSALAAQLRNEVVIVLAYSNSDYVVSACTPATIIHALC